MICPYNGFKKCDWKECAARMYVQDPTEKHCYMKVCAIAYNGGTIHPANEEKAGDTE